MKAYAIKCNRYPEYYVRTDNSVTTNLFYAKKFESKDEAIKYLIKTRDTDRFTIVKVEIREVKG